MEKHDVVIVGGGHNGLVVAAYLAKAGVDVCVVEMKDEVGGAVITKELTLPGFKHDPGSVMHGMISANPLIHRDELGLKSKYGLKYTVPDRQFAVIFPDDSSLVFYRDIDKTCESISQFSRKDAEAYRRFHKSASEMLKVASVAAFSPPPSWGTMMSFFDASEEGREFLRIALSSAVDVAEDWFESEQLKIALTRFASEAMTGPQEKGTGRIMFFVTSLHSWGWGVPVGGSGSLTKALAAFIKDNGGTIKVSSPVKSVRLEAGKAKGVVLENGDEIAATRAVVSNVNVKQLFLDMLKPDELPPGLPDKVKRIRHATFSAIHQALALNNAPKYKAGREVDNAFMVECVPATMEEFLQSFNEYSFGITNTSMPLMVTATIFDPSRAPEGKHTLYLYHYEPYNLKGGGPNKWNEIKQDIADRVLETTARHATNMGADNILGRWIMSPLDLEQYFPSMLAGDIGHIGQFLTQYYAYRPLPGMGQYRTPISGLYMCGASTHTGLGVNGSGRAAVQVIMEDLGISFKKVIAK
ncbi:MAG: NAD(P)/FAD-dependent oxidoreductase [Chloroflexi bacterium]|nr:NAD(P)/FAD-dependent oxidoreductase [Chloroflexota bacterium]